MADSDNESGGGNGGGEGGMDGSGEFSFPREQDRFLPIANVSRIMKKALPGNAKISKDAKETVQECVSEFISFITGEASDKCQREKRKTINGDDLLWAMTTLGFEEYVDPLKVYLHKFREMEGEKVVVVVGSKEGGGGSIVNMGGIGIAAGGGGYGGGMYGGGMVMGQMYDGSPPSSSSSSYHRQHHHHQMSMGMGMAGSYVNGGGNGGNSSTSGPGGASVGATGNGGIGRQGS